MPTRLFSVSETAEKIRAGDRLLTQGGQLLVAVEAPVLYLLQVAGDAAVKADELGCQPRLRRRDRVGVHGRALGLPARGRGAALQRALVLPQQEGALDAGIDVLDVGCGRGRALLAMASEYPNSRFHGYDLSGEAVRAAQAEAGEMTLYAKIDEIGAALRDGSLQTGVAPVKPE